MSEELRTIILLLAYAITFFAFRIECRRSRALEDDNFRLRRERARNCELSDE